MKKPAVKWIILAVFLVCAAAFLVVGMRIGNEQKNKDYHAAMECVENYCFESAEMRFRELIGFRDAEEKTAEMTELNRVTKAEVLKLLQIPDFSEEKYGYSYYWCEDEKISMSICWYQGGWADKYVTWNEKTHHKNDEDACKRFFGDIDDDHYSENIIRFDSDTMEYILLQSIVSFDDNYMPGDIQPFEEVYRARLNERGDLEIYNNQGVVYLFSYDGFYNVTDEIRSGKSGR